MSRLDKDREVICTLALPLPLKVAGAVGGAVAASLEQLGWSNVVLLFDGTNRVVATRPAPVEPEAPTC